MAGRASAAERDSSLMNQNLYTSRSSNIAKTWLLMAGFLVFFLAVGFFAGEYFGNPAIFTGFLAFSIMMNVASYWYSDRIVLAMHHAKPATKAEHYDLYTVTENLSIAAGLPMPKLYVINDPAPNAFATGRDKEHGVVAVTTGLLDILERRELEGVVAHELAHIGNRDILLGTAVVVLVGFISLISDFFLRSAVWGGNRENKGGPLAAIGIVFLILSPVIATVMQLAVSRKREFLADATGALITRYPEGLADALRKISNSARPLSSAHNATAHLFIANPLGGRDGKPGAFAKLFMTHPPVEERIKALLGSTHA